MHGSHFVYGLLKCNGKGNFNGKGRYQFSGNYQYKANQPQKQWLNSDVHMYQFITGFPPSWNHSCENNSHGHVFMIFTLAFSARGQ